MLFNQCFVCWARQYFYALVNEANVSVYGFIGQLKEQGKLNPLKFDFDFNCHHNGFGVALLPCRFNHTTSIGTNQTWMVQRTLAG